MALAHLDRLVGTVCFDGRMFGGSHLIECYDIGDELRIAVKVDGNFHKPKSWRGLLRMICKRLLR